MNYVGGYYNGYESIDKYRLYLDLSMTDQEFMTLQVDPLAISETMSYQPNFQDYSVIGNFNNPPQKIWDVINNNKDTKKFADIIRGYRLEKLLNGELSNQITAFIPVSDANDILYNLQTTVSSMEDILKYHIVDYPILPVQLFNTINRIETKFKPHYLTVFGTGNNLFIVKPSDRFYRNKILRTLKTDNGYIYFIEKPLIPSIF